MENWLILVLVCLFTVQPIHGAKLKAANLRALNKEVRAALLRLVTDNLRLSQNNRLGGTNYLIDRCRTAMEATYQRCRTCINTGCSKANMCTIDGLSICQIAGSTELSCEGITYKSGPFDYGVLQVDDVVRRNMRRFVRDQGQEVQRFISGLQGLYNTATMQSKEKLKKSLDTLMGYYRSVKKRTDEGLRRKSGGFVKGMGRVMAREMGTTGNALNNNVAEMMSEMTYTLTRILSNHKFNSTTASKSPSKSSAGASVVSRVMGRKKRQATPFQTSNCPPLENVISDCVSSHGTQCACPSQSPEAIATVCGSDVVNGISTLQNKLKVIQEIMSNVARHVDLISKVEYEGRIGYGTDNLEYGNVKFESIVGVNTMSFTSTTNLKIFQLPVTASSMAKQIWGAWNQV